MTTPAWMTKGKTIAELIEELSRFEDQTLEVRISVDDGETHVPISLVGNKDGACVLFHFPADEKRPADGEDK